MRVQGGPCKPFSLANAHRSSKGNRRPAPWSETSSPNYPVLFGSLSCQLLPFLEQEQDKGHVRDRDFFSCNNIISRWPRLWTKQNILFGWYILGIRLQCAIKTCLSKLVSLSFSKRQNRFLSFPFWFLAYIGNPFFSVDIEEREIRAYIYKAMDMITSGFQAGEILCLSGSMVAWWWRYQKGF